MDEKLLAEWHKHHDEKFTKVHPQFVAWWSRHPHNDAPARIAFKCQCYQQEYMEAKQHGLIQQKTS